MPKRPRSARTPPRRGGAAEDDDHGPASCFVPGALEAAGPAAQFAEATPYTHVRLQSVFDEALLLQVIVSFRRTLLRLDASGMGDVVLPTLLVVGLDQLQTLRVGETMDSLHRGTSGTKRDDDDDEGFHRRVKWPPRVRRPGSPTPARWKRRKRSARSRPSCAPTRCRTAVK